MSAGSPSSYWRACWMKVAVVTSLLRHVRNPDLLREKYGSVPKILRGISRDPALVPALMATLKAQVPNAQHVISQSFWRTLNNLDTELPVQIRRRRRNED